jgi:hypothetical protein
MYSVRLSHTWSETDQNDETRNTELHTHTHDSTWLRVPKARQLTAGTSALAGEWSAIFISGESANDSQRLRIWVSSKVAQHKVTISNQYRTLAIRFGVSCVKHLSYIDFNCLWALTDTAKLYNN